MQITYYEGNSFLHHLNPLSKVVAITPALIFLALTTEPWTPLAFIVWATLIALGLGRIPVKRFVRIAAPMLWLVIGFLLVYPLVVRRELVQHTPIFVQFGPIRVYEGGVYFGLATALRVYALLLISLLFSLTTDSGDFIRAVVQQWHLPYKLGYGAMAVFRFVPMLQRELDLIRAAHRVRGVAEKGGLRAHYKQLRRYLIPLLATAIRQAERTALAMDGRAFGAYETRTYFRRMRFGLPDYMFIAGFWLVSFCIVLGLAWAGLLGRLALWQTL
jgi:energy-coupling factor transport system permease protein